MEDRGSGGRLVQPRTEEEVIRLVEFVRGENVPFLVIGKGTNLLFPDGGIRGVVMKLGRLFSDFSIAGTEVRARGGIWVPKLVKNLADAGLSGFEHAAGIPGSLGGLVTMNGGSLRHSAGENIRSVDAVSLAGERRTFTKDECGFSLPAVPFPGSSRRAGEAVDRPRRRPGFPALGAGGGEEGTDPGPRGAQGQISP